MKGFYKDEVLNKLAEEHNVAQFVSFGPDMRVRFQRISGYIPDTLINTPLDYLTALFEASGEQSINIRSFLPNQPRSNEFIYGITSLPLAMSELVRLSDQGLYTIVNETIDVNDGGVSGVLQNDMVEFAPGVVPRFVETSTEQVATFPKGFASELIQIVYGFDPGIARYPSDTRLEFSIHPTNRGYSNRHTIVWEIEEVPFVEVPYHLSWPTDFSRFIGDKAYGLLMADTLGFPVPRTTVYPRNPKLSPFSFGEPTNSPNEWVRTCPNIQVPGKYTTTRVWENPYELMDKDDPTGEILVSCLGQQEVPAHYSGALLSDGENITVEGVLGFGDNFMQAEESPITLPRNIRNNVITLYNNVAKVLGPVRFEWAHDGNKAWLLQLHTGAVVSSGRVIVPGEFKNSIDFDVKSGLEALRNIIKNIKPGFGIIVNGNVGMSSHIADMLRKAEVPSVLTSPKLSEGA